MRTAEGELMNLLVYGATGSQGDHPSRAKELHNLGAEIVQGDLGSKASGNVFTYSTSLETSVRHHQEAFSKQEVAT